MSHSPTVGQKQAVGPKHGAENRIPPRGRLSRGVARGLRPCNALFDWLYHSEYNPFYRSGALAIGLLFVLLVTGFYLLFFYSVSHPYESVARIQEQVWLGRWVRALHRYATDATLIAVVFHVLQLLSHGKTWGPRTLAWISGMVLLGALIVSVMTGYVMVWDTHGQLVALSGLRLLDVLPIFGPGVSLAFSGAAPIPSSFFFMNLFLHVAVPLAMVFGMWVHTARLARTVWLPIRAVFWGVVLALLLLSILYPATLAPQADLLRLLGRVPVDLWFGFWIPLLDVVGPVVVLLLVVVCVLIGFSLPWWWRPAAQLYPPLSEVDEDGCTGCTQCARDCPYEAITMIPHRGGKHLLAQVSPLHCVSCGICAASCDVMVVGPPGRTAEDQISRVKELLATLESEELFDAVAVVACRHNDSVPGYLQELASSDAKLHYIDLNCCATLHSDTIELLLASVGGIFLSGCAARNCMNRDGLDILKGRLYGKRVPFVAREIDRKRIFVAPHSESERTQVERRVRAFRTALSSDQAVGEQSAGERVRWFVKRTVATGVLVLLVGVLSQVPLGVAPDHGELRVVGRLPSHVDLGCRPLTQSEKQSLPVHMQRKEVCKKAPIQYRLAVRLAGADVYTRKLSSGSRRTDQQLLINERIPLAVGHSALEVDIRPLSVQESAREGEPPPLMYRKEVDVTAQNVILVNVNSPG